MPAKWDDTADKKLLFFVVKSYQNNPDKAVFKEAATMFGDEFNENACYQRFYKLKREADSLINGSGGASSSTSQPFTPAGTKKTATKKASAKSAAKVSAKAKKRAADDDSDDDVEAGTPSKKVKEDPGAEQDEAVEA